MSSHIQIRRDASSNWTSVNPVLADGELGYDQNNSNFKIGNGVSSYTQLPYLITGGAGGGIAVSGGGSLFSTGTLSLGNANGFSFITSNGSIVGSYTDGGGAGGMVTLSGSNGTLQSNGITILGSNIVSAYTTTGNQFVIAAPAQTDLTNHAHSYSNATTAVSSRVVQIAASNATLSGNVVITGSNGINIGTAGGGQIVVSLIDSHHVEGIQLSGNNLGTAFSIMSSGSQTINFAGAISGSQNGNAFTMSVPTQSVQTQNSVLINGNSGAFTLAGTNSGATGCNVTVNSSGVSVSVPAQTVQPSAVVMATNSTGGGTSTGTGNTLSFSNGNGVSFWVTNNSQINAIVVTNYSTGYSAKAESTHSHGNPTLALTNINGTTASASNGLTISLSAAAGGGNTVTVSGSNGTIQSNGLSFIGSNGAQVYTTTGNQIVISVPTAGGAQTGISGIEVGGTTYTQGTVTFGNRAGVSFITSNGSICLSEEPHIYHTGWSLVGNTAGTNSTANTNEQLLYLSGGANVTLSGNSNTIVVSAAAGGGGAATYSIYQPLPLGANSTFSSAGQSSLYLQKVRPEFNYTFSAIERYASVSTSSNTNNQSVNYTINYGMYSRDAGTNSTRMTLMASSQLEMRFAASSNSSAAYSIIQGAGTNASNSGSIGLFSNVTAGKHMYFPYSTSLAAGQEYWMGFHVMSASTVSSQVLRLAFLELTNINNLTWGKIKGTSNIASNASFVGDYAQGVLSAQTAAFPNTLADSQLTNQVSLGRQYLQFDNT